MELQNRISINPKICHGQPCVKGTRIMVTNILAALAEGLSFDEIIAEFLEIVRDPGWPGRLHRFRRNGLNEQTRILIAVLRSPRRSKEVNWSCKQWKNNDQTLPHTQRNA